MNFKQPPVPKFQEKPKMANYTSMHQIAIHQPHLLEKDITQNPVQLFEPVEEEKPRTLSAPNMQLVGHQGEVYCVKFSPNGDFLATAGYDKKILLWDIYNDCKNIGILGECQNAILDLQWSTEGTRLFVASADKTLVVYDMETYQPMKKFRGHTSHVNSCYPTRRGAELVVSGSDDGTTKIWDLRTKKFAMQFEGIYPITAVTFSDQGDKIYTGGLDNTIKSYDLRKQEIELTLSYHADTITGIQLNQDGAYLLSNSLDMTLRVFDIRSYVAGKNRQVRIFTGATHNSAEKNLIRCAWSPDGQYVAGGSSDRYVYIWDYNTKKLAHRLSGHNGTVNEIAFSPKDKLLASASSDRTVIIGEIPDVAL